MSMISRQAAHRESVAYGGLIDAVGGVATIILAALGLAGLHAPLLAAIATIVFGIALLIQCGTMASEYAQLLFPFGGKAIMKIDEFGGRSLSVVFLAGAAGVILGVLALLGVNAVVLTSIAMITFGTALILSSSAVFDLLMLSRGIQKSEGRYQEGQGRFGWEILAIGSVGLQVLAGVVAIVLGVLALVGAANALTLTLVALLALGAALVLTGGSLSATVLSLMRSA
jgi:hypothetical protein